MVSMNSLFCFGQEYELDEKIVTGIFEMDGKKKNIPIIALTASVLTSEVEKCLKSGMNDFIPKPFTNAELLDTMVKHYKS